MCVYKPQFNVSCLFTSFLKLEIGSFTTTPILDIDTLTTRTSLTFVKIQQISLRKL